MKKYGLYLAWIIAIGATLGSLFFGEFRHHAPCTLCWYQRVIIFPLAVILGIAAFRGASKIILYVLPLSLIGLGIALYHVLTMTIFITPLNCTVCTIDAVTGKRSAFPFLSLGVFFVLNILLIWTAIVNKKSSKF